MSKFKVGDRVIRTVCALASGEHNGMRVGDADTVVRVGGGELGLAQFGAGHYAEYFKVVAPAATARKDDSGKLDMNLLDDMPRALKAVVEVMQWAIVDKKPVPYVRGSWLGVEPDRYRAAIKRHERAAAEQATTEVPARLQRDDETNLLHLAHTACSAMMALENVLREQEKQ